MKSQVLALKKRREWNDGDIYDYYIHEKQVKFFLSQFLIFRYGMKKERVLNYKKKRRK